MLKNRLFCRKFTSAISLIGALLLCEALAGDAAARAAHKEQQAKPVPLYKYCPKSILKFVTSGDAYMEAENYNAALKMFTAAIAIEPKAYFVYARRADTYSLLHKQDLALADLDKCISLNGTVANHYLQRGRLEDTMGKNQEALRDYEFAIAHGMTTPYKDAARVCERLGKLDKSVEHLSNCISHQRALEKIPFLFDRARVYGKLGKTALAAQDKQLAAKLLKDCGTDNIDDYPNLVRSRN